MRHRARKPCDRNRHALAELLQYGGLVASNFLGLQQSVGVVVDALEDAHRDANENDQLVTQQVDGALPRRQQVRLCASRSQQQAG